MINQLIAEQQEIDRKHINLMGQKPAHYIVQSGFDQKKGRYASPVNRTGALSMLSPKNQDLIDKTSRNTLQTSENKFFQVPRTRDVQQTGRMVGMLKAACIEFKQSAVNYNSR